MDSLGVSNEQFSKSKLEKAPSAPGSSAISSSTAEGDEIFSVFILFYCICGRREIPATGAGAGAAQVGGDEAGEADCDLRLLHGEDVRGARHHQLRVGGDELLLQQAFLLPELPARLPVLQHAAAPVHGQLLLQPRLCGTLRQVGATAANRV